MFDLGDESNLSSSPSYVHGLIKPVMCSRPVALRCMHFCRTDTVKTIRALDAIIFLEHAQTMYKAFLGAIEGLQAQNALLLEIVDGVRPRSVPAPRPTCRMATYISYRRPSLRSPASSSSTSVSSTLSPALQETLANAAELVNSYAARVLNVRAEEHAKLELREFYELFNKTWQFVVRTEVLSRRMIVGLRGAIVSQVGRSLLQFRA